MSSVTLLPSYCVESRPASGPRPSVSAAARRAARLVLFLFIGLGFMPNASAQNLNSATIAGQVTDPSGAAMPAAAVQIQNPVSGYVRAAQTDDQGNFRFDNVPFNNYHLSVTSGGFQAAEQDIDARSSVPLELKISLKLGSSATSVTVSAEARDLIEQTPTAHADVDRKLIEQLPIQNVTTGLSEVIMRSSPSVVADSNGFFHPMGDHAEAQISLDNQPITDQYSKIYSNQIPVDAIQSMEVITGTAPAEYGDKASLVINATSRTGLGDTPPHGSFVTQYGSFATPETDFSLGMGNQRWGNFAAAYFTNSNWFLDSPEFQPFHDIGNGEGLFDRVDFNPTQTDTFHLTLQLSRSWFQIPNTYDQVAAAQDQHEQIRSLNIAPGFTHLFNAKTLLTFNPYVRIDHVQYYPSADLLSDLPATLTQDRRLAVYGARADLSYSQGIHNAKAGVEFKYDQLSEGFGLGITDPTFNPVCFNLDGSPDTAPTPISTSQCAGLGLTANASFLPGLLPFDLTRGGRLFLFNEAGNNKLYSAYVQDAISYRNFTFNVGARGDIYRGLSAANQLEPRLGAAYRVSKTNTVLRFSYGRFLETPLNENLLLSSATGAGGLASNVFGAFAATPLQSGRRNEYDTGFEQALGHNISVSGDYFWKFTNNGFDVDTLFSTPLTFPIAWSKSKLDGFGIRANLLNTHGLTIYSVMGHARARYFPPENGGVIFNSPIGASVFRIDHDQAFQQNTHVQYQFPKHGPWVGFSWEYQSGLVAGSVPDLASVLALDADQQTAIGFFCGSDVASLTNPIASCNLPYPQWGATRVRIPAPGTENDDTDPPRIRPRNLFDLGTGMDNILHTDRYKVNLQFTVINLTNKDALYNFLSTFSGTHFVTPRTWQGSIHFVF